MYSNYELTLDENFNKALDLCSNHHSHDELIEYLKSGNLPEKQFAAIELKSLNSFDDVEIFLSNLINCDGKIREAVAQKFSEFVHVKEYKNYFVLFPQTFAKSTIDINANISRMVIDSLVILKDEKEFGSKYVNELKKYINEAFVGLSKIVFRDKKYTINKQIFKLYWCLEGLNNYYQYLSDDELGEILEISLNQNEYTVREKVAQLLSKPSLKSKFPQLVQKLLLDDNYYVKRYKLNL